VFTYADGTQDVGLWHGEKLVKICTAISEAFSMDEHKEFEFDPNEHLQYLDSECPSGKEAFENLLKEPDLLYTPDNQITERVSDIFNIALDPRSLAINKEAFDRAFYEESVANGDKKDDEKILVWNRTPSIISMQKHFHKHKYGVGSVSENVDKILAGNRSGFKEKGPLEVVSEELIQAATDGNVNLVEDLLYSGKVSPDVADSNGHTALIGATVSMNLDGFNL